MHLANCAKGKSQNPSEDQLSLRRMRSDSPCVVTTACIATSISNAHKLSSPFVTLYSLTQQLSVEVLSLFLHWIFQEGASIFIAIPCARVFQHCSTADFNPLLDSLTSSVISFRPFPHCSNNSTFPWPPNEYHTEQQNVTRSVMC